MLYSRQFLPGGQTPRAATGPAPCRPTPTNPDCRGVPVNQPGEDDGEQGAEGARKLEQRVAELAGEAMADPWQFAGALRRAAGAGAAPAAADLDGGAIAAYGRALDEGRTTCQKQVGSMLERLGRVDGTLNAYLDVFGEEALDRARQLDRQRGRDGARGPLHGVPVAVKDIFDFRRHRASGGAGYALPRAAATATVVQRLEDAGAIVLGVLNLDELSAGGSGDNRFFGRCLNPWQPDRLAGGSSGGSAAAVSAALAMASIGADAGGSIRIPAAWCGVVGLKPTYGSVSRHGAAPRTWSMDCIGPMAATAADVAAVYEVIRGHDANDASTLQVATAPVAPRTRWRIAVLADAERLSGDDPNYRAALQALAADGHRVEELALPFLDELTALQQVVVKCEAAALHGQRLRDTSSPVSHAVRSVIADGFHLHAARYLEALCLRADYLRRYTALLEGYDALALPAGLPEAPSFHATDTMSGEEVDRRFSESATLTRFANYLGVPALVVPTGVSTSGLPTALQLAGTPFREHDLLRLAGVYERLRGPMPLPAGLDVLTTPA